MCVQRQDKVCLCKSTPRHGARLLTLCHRQRENHGCYLDDHPWSSYSISFKRPWLVTGLSGVLPDLFQNHHIFWFPVGVPISSPFAARCYHVLCASPEAPRATPGSNGGRWWCPLRHICMAWRLWSRRNSNEGTSRNGRMHIPMTADKWQWYFNAGIPSLSGITTTICLFLISPFFLPGFSFVCHHLSLEGAQIGHFAGAAGMLWERRVPCLSMAVVVPVQWGPLVRI